MVGKLLGRCMSEVFGEMIAVLPDLADGGVLPSPESLKRKIIIKGKVVKNGEVSHLVFDVLLACGNETLLP